MRLPSVLITGCSDGGIGSALALAFHKRGYHVFATARDTSKMGLLRDLANATYLQLDVTKPYQIALAVDAVRERTDGRLDFLVNNAGYTRFMPLLDEDPDACRQLFETNVWGALAVTQSFAPLLIRARGTVSFITSITGHFHLPFMGVYNASKASMDLMAETLRLELAPFGVKTVSLITGAVETRALAFFNTWSLPPASRYKPIEPVITARVRGVETFLQTPTTDYADQVADKLINGTSGRVWTGANSTLMWLLVNYVPGWIQDRVLFFRSGLGRITAHRE
ncbi:SDR family oxidoreductase [Aspergillus candidus]|uniref:Putative hydroxybutyrate dehydrogenase n=1 Tax=Aspergillus candidus TaxID=41067 RepID=A0A2I2F3U9_ASPCN|nr:putative hydroxybutyrate dehydrogenase [Aspergillus candidus]PLB35327.1 putative hydroxybutyrate dehydrogenase [Aspergillus candidus]